MSFRHSWNNPCTSPRSPTGRPGSGLASSQSTHPLDHIYVPAQEAVEAARTPRWEQVISAIAQVTGLTGEGVCQVVEPLMILGPALALPRFMPAATCESWVLAEVARQLGVTAVQWYLSHDKYVEFNPEKRLMLHHRVIRDPTSPNANRLKDQHLHPNSRELTGVRLDQIQVENGHGPVNLVDFHRQWWMNCGWGGVEVDASAIARALLGDNPRKEQWYPVYFLLMCGNLMFLESYEPRYCQPLWPLVGQVWDSIQRQGLRPLIVRLPLTPETDWFLETAQAPPPKAVRALAERILGNSRPG